jgi:hypothetical protein
MGASSVCGAVQVARGVLDGAMRNRRLLFNHLQATCAMAFLCSSWESLTPELRQSIVLCLSSDSGAIDFICGRTVAGGDQLLFWGGRREEFSSDQRLITAVSQLWLADTFAAMNKLLKLNLKTMAVWELSNTSPRWRQHGRADFPHRRSRSEDQRLATLLSINYCGA